MTKKQIIIALVTFIVGFGITFFVIRTYFPKQKTEKNVDTSNSIVNKGK